MSSIDHLPNVGIASVSWNRSESAAESLPEKSLKPLGKIQPSYIERIFNAHRSNARIEEALTYQVTNDSILTPSNYQDILEQLRRTSANTESDHPHREIFTRTFQLLDELAGNIHQLNLNRLTESSS